MSTPERQVERRAEATGQFARFRPMARIEHIILLLSFSVLLLTGLPQKYAVLPIAQSAINAMGGVETVRVIHRWAAVILVLGSIYHLLTSGYRTLVRHERMRMMPDKKDFDDLVGTVTYNLGFRDEHPWMRKFNFGEKIEYWAVVWGTAVMIITGFMLWNPIATTTLLPGSFIPAAKSAHGWEAVLAFAAIIIWHIYNVLIKHRNWSMFTGTLPLEQMEEEHALELARLEAGGSPWQEVNALDLHRRRVVFFAVSGVVAFLAMALVYWMFTFEATAITTVPRATQEVFVPLVTPVP